VRARAEERTRLEVEDRFVGSAAMSDEVSAGRQAVPGDPKQVGVAVARAA
jgi:hypothetical protein